MEFSYKTKAEGSTVELHLVGYFDEFAKLPSPDDFSEYSKVIIDFSAVEFINSGGIKVWLGFADNLGLMKDLTSEMQGCRRFVVDQVNMIEGFVPKNGKVTSVFVPIFCDKCEVSFDVHQPIATLDKDFPDVFDKVKPDDCKEFPKCRKYFELDIVKDSYFRFLDNE